MTRRLAITVRGVVQGVGFRPFVYQIARAAGLAGWVENQSDAVRLEVEGPEKSLELFLDRLRRHHPPRANIEQLDVVTVPCQDAWHAQTSVFEIRASRAATAKRPTIPPDLATCDACQLEIADPTQRRYGYPFTNCTHCGPRWSIITGLPYDRPLTSMHPFAMCPDCQREYEDPADRRFHAQPIACPACGPQLQLLDTQGVPRASAADALHTAAEAVRDGAILALKGLGGFQLIVDALNAQAVEQLRARKHRPHKPFAVMLPDLDAVRRYCHVSSLEERQLTAPEAPIVLLRKRAAVPAAATMAEAIAPGNPYLGVMLPNTPLHWLLLRHLQRPVVCTSGNLAEEPMATETLEALERLGDIADLVLTHDRTIVRPVDDSVCRVEDGSLQVLRRARGFAPTPIALPFTPPCVLAVGGHLKNCVALTVGDRVVVGSHVGDLDNTLSLEVHRRSIDDLLDFFSVNPQIIACDLHPDYVSTQHAERLAIRFDVPLARIQHHHAHVLSAIAEHQLEGPVLGLAWDGTGYGPDGTIWGGEALTVDGPHWERVAHVRAFPLVGGDRAAREPRRSALGVLYETGDRSCESFAACGFAPSELSPLLAALERPHLFPRTSSMGRLFDAVAALCGLGPHVTFEGQAAMQLEYVADADERGSYPMPIADSLPAVADWGPAVAAILEDRTHGTPVPIIAGRFHNSLACLAREIALRCNCPRIVLTGGCFQNRLLTHRTRHCLSEAGFAVYTQRVVPPGDGGIALGQVLGAYYQVGD